MNRILIYTAIVVALLAWRTMKPQNPDDAKPAPAKQEKDGGGPEVKISREMQARIELKVEKPAKLELAPEAVAYGVVLDPAPLVALHGERVAAEAALTASRLEFERVGKLHEDQANASRRSLEAAEAQFRADEARAHTAALQILTSWGPDCEALIENLVKGQTVIVRATLPAGDIVSDRPAGATIVPLGREEHPLAAAAIFDATSIDPRVQGQAFFIRLDLDGVSLPPGTAVTAHLQLSGDKVDGVMIPRSAIVRYLGMAWIYVKEGDEKFERREVPLARSTDDGWFVTQGVEDDDQIVVAGAQVVLSEELKASIQGDD